MIVQAKEYSVLFDAEAARITFSGQMRLRSAREYDDIKALLRQALAQRSPHLVLDFRELEYLNSSGIGTIGQFLVEARQAASTQIALQGSALRPWQARSLGTLQRIWDQVQLTIDE